MGHLLETFAQRDTGRELVLVLPGLLDHGEWNIYQQLGVVVKEAGCDCKVLDMYGLEGIKEDPAEPGSYICNWKPSDYMHLIHDTVSSHTNQRARIIAISYATQIALMYARVAKDFSLGTIDAVAGVVPPNYWHWEGYDAQTDLKWMIRQYKENHRIDLQTTQNEVRSESEANPQNHTPVPADGHVVRITRQSMSDHLTPFQELVPGNSIPVVFTGLVESGLLEGVDQETLLIAGTLDTLTPDAAGRVQAINDSFSRGHHEIVELPIPHDFRDKPEQTEAVYVTLREWLAA